eukprot:Hpha_TRINITY_DN3641_c0_g1::TRINITY_DN3641_c0_g1_i1::g.1018::m.1018
MSTAPAWPGAIVPPQKTQAVRWLREAAAWFYGLAADVRAPFADGIPPVAQFKRDLLAALPHDQLVERGKPLIEVATRLLGAQDAMEGTPQEDGDGGDFRIAGLLEPTAPPTLKRKAGEGEDGKPVATHPVGGETQPTGREAQLSEVLQRLEALTVKVETISTRKEPAPEPKPVRW